MNAALSGVVLDKVLHPDQVPMLWDGKSLAGGAESVDYRHDGKAAVAFADGHLAWLGREEFQRLRLSP
jgi:prepilin-type processing-associated H-X9-DG protein